MFYVESVEAMPPRSGNIALFFCYFLLHNLVKRKQQCFNTRTANRGLRESPQR